MPRSQVVTPSWPKRKHPFPVQTTDTIHARPAHNGRLEPSVVRSFVRLDGAAGVHSVARKRQTVQRSKFVVPIAGRHLAQQGSEYSYWLCSMATAEVANGKASRQQLSHLYGSARASLELIITICIYRGSHADLLTARTTLPFEDDA